LVRVGFFLVIILGMLNANAASPNEKTYATLNQAISKTFPNTKTTTMNIRLTAKQIAAIETTLMATLPTPNITIYQFNRQDETVGYGMVTNQIGKYKPITFFVGVNPEFQIEGVVVMVYREGYGSNVRKKRFVRQFKGKTMKAPLAVNHDITTVSGATLSSYAIANGTKRVLAIINEAL